MRSAPTPLDTFAFGLAGASIAALLTTLCALAVALAPEASVASASYMVHLDLAGLAPSVTWGSFFVGLICWSLGTGLVFTTTAAFYNRFLGPGGAEARVRGG
jgi:hypothetical protein